MSTYRSLVVAPILVLISAVTWAETTSLPLTDDVRINANKPTVNFDGYDLLAHDYGPKQSLVRFDAASVSGQTINSAVLELHLSSIRQNGTISLHAITSSWSEASATWNNQPPAEVAAAAIVNLTTGDAGGTVAIDVTATVQRWADGSLADAGFLIATNDDIKALFDAKENAAGTPARLQVETDDLPQPPSPGTGSEPVVLDLSNPPVVIDEPGRYILDRDWRIEGLPNSTVVIDMQVAATIDMRGFEIWDDDTTGGTVIRIGADGGTVINGRIVIEGWEGNGIWTTGPTVIRDMKVKGHYFGGGVTVDGSLTMSDSVVVSGLVVGRLGGGDGSLITSSHIISGGGSALVVSGDNITISRNRIDGFDRDYLGFLIGDRIEFSQNDVGFCAIPGGLTVRGNYNAIYYNSFKPCLYDGSQAGIVLKVDGTRNIIKDNIIFPGVDPEPVGISFLQDGNIYGDNQVSAVIPFELGGTVQVDLGGNVGL
jgi:hypothetical protein